MHVLDMFLDMFPPCVGHGRYVSDPWMYQGFDEHVTDILVMNSIVSAFTLSAMLSKRDSKSGQRWLEIVMLWLDFGNMVTTSVFVFLRIEC